MRHTGNRIYCKNFILQIFNFFFWYFVTNVFYMILLNIKDSGSDSTDHLRFPEPSLGGDPGQDVDVHSIRVDGRVPALWDGRTGKRSS